MSDALQPLVVFSHGKETGPNGRKIRQLRAIAEQAGAQTLSIDYTATQEPSARVDILLNTILPAHRGLILVGSSMGGYVSTTASAILKPEALLLMAPAFGLAGYANPLPAPCAESVAAVHGWQDDVVPAENVITWAKQHQVMLTLVNDDHSLHQTVTKIGALLTSMILHIKTSDSVTAE